MKTKRTSNGAKILVATTAAMIANVSHAALVAEETAQRLVPVDKGDLKSTTYKEDDGLGHASLGTGGPSRISDRYVNHHIFIEWGTSKMPAQSYYRPGIDDGRRALIAGMKIIAG